MSPVRNTLYRAIRDAARVHGLSDAVVRTAEALIDFIPAAAHEPISPVQVQRLADARGCDPRTVRNHIARLLALGLVADRRRDGGGRALVRDSAGAIVGLYGVSFAPLARDAPQLAARAADLAAQANAKARLRCEISVIRRRLKRLLAHLAPGDLHAGFAEAPRRFAELDLGGLTQLWHAMADLCALAEEQLADLRARAVASAVAQDAARPVENALSSVESADRSENSDRPLHITTDTTDDFCNRTAIKTAEKLKTGAGAGAPGKPHAAAAGTGLEHVTLEMALDAAPEDWRRELKAAGGDPSWAALVALAHARCVLLGINADAWHCAVSALGRSGAAIVVMIADANHTGRGGAVRSAGGWVRAVTRRAELGEANLCRSIFGLLAKGGKLQ